MVSVLIISFMLIVITNPIVASLLAPDFLHLQKLIDTVTVKFRYRRFHVSRMRKDRLNRLLREEYFTVFIQGATARSIPIRKFEFT